MRDRELDETVRSHLADHNTRYTGGRRLVVRALHAADGPQSVAELHARLKRTVPLSSLYRSLTILEQTGVVALHQGRVARYELSEWLAGHHHHLVCLQCGAIGDFELDREAEQVLHRLAGRAGRRGGYRVNSHTLEVEGLCEACQ
ncbi:MAG: Fur family transcriptional regulator [Actinomycetota bacterium]